ncbi:actophorin, putative [Entamoeba histolytica HM-1:IMSS-B]|uniref:Actophorin n=8 Tax=Entamoeba TaxID=5758 RepID=ACTP_ENTH1|nr:actophorin, putative [Entamoeba nuttalli P19]XP_651689.1 actophorin, putative [Entamoeba histolytica HM-1:IMSS]C4LVG4.1 RecName: Full=Actophorin; Short=EhActo [Entamoeba histolytica HM-1:IMSS]EMD49583.1 actophorin, putative [Entamoeba histolytica KU27]EMH77844.1 actophorin, putative [Entamoeba histolytica HM-1:IMSS-B]EMS13827.1 actophorin, putative [Entamoeba histolytica HM-3:IMSS]ENY62046.1 actophorin, putative [Entamoeba histolytica HM-1:IMSS-A]BAN38656.1 actophorin, putative [Entamoeba|eukprot:XP_008854638.1 actophorin, putative [Entamoeba nuttalli P19]
MAGIQLADEVTSVYNDFKLSHKYRYIVFKMNDGMTEVVVEKTAEKNATYDDFLKDLPEKSARYAVYDLEYDTPEGLRQKIIFYLWTPEGCKIREKMLYSATKATIKQALVGLSAEIQATDAGELNLDEVIAKVKTISK